MRCPGARVGGLADVIAIGKLSADQGRHYLDQTGEPTTATDAVTSGAEEYYVGGPEASGEWLGTGAAALKLSGRAPVRR